MVEEISIDLEQWAQNQDTSIELDVHGQIIDYIDPQKRRQNTPEERIRQLLVRSLNMEYGYDIDCLALEVPIFRGTMEIKDKDKQPTRADVVIYRTPETCKSREQSGIAAIFETKKPDEQAGITQLTSYLSQTLAEGGGWTNGKQIKFFRRVLQSDGTTQLLKPWPGFPKASQDWDAVGKYKKSQLVVPHNLKPVFVKCHNALYRSGISSEDVAMDMVRIILAKRHDELSFMEDCHFYCTPSEYENSKGRQKVAERVHGLFAQVRDLNLDVFGEEEKITASEIELAEVVSQLQMYSFTKAEIDVIGAAYEVYVASHLKGERGQFFTNRLLIRLIVSIVDPIESDIVIDPACGSGGFLVAALRHVREKIEQQPGSKESKEGAIEQIRRNLYGVDISPRLVKVAQANMMLGKDGHSGIAQGDSLSNIMKTLPERITRRAGLGAPSVVLTNPPFGSSSQHRITSRETLDQFDLGFKWDPRPDGLYKKTKEMNREGHPPEVLFMERCLQWAKPGGRIGIVMARGQVDDVKSRAMRSMLLERSQILAVINAHEDSFEPFNGSKASLIVVRKLKENEKLPEDYKIFMGISKKIGQNSRGEPIFKVDDAGERLIVKGQNVLDDDTDEIIDSWKAFKKGAEIKHPFCYSINRSQIVSPDLSMNPVRYLPKFNNAITKVIEIGNRDGWKVETLGDIASAVFNGPRFKRPYAAEGITSGPGIVPYYTGTAMTQSKGENIKHFDLNKASKVQKRQIEELIIHTNWILITDSGTIGRVIYTLPHHDGVPATNNLIRVVIENEMLRAYVYQFLQTELGQNQLKKNIYGTNQDHLEPRLVRDVLIPIPKDEKILTELSKKALDAIRYSIQAQESYGQAQEVLNYHLRPK